MFLLIRLTRMFLLIRLTRRLLLIPLTRRLLLIPLTRRLLLIPLTRRPSSYSPPSEGLGVVSEELKAVFRCSFFVALMYFRLEKRSNICKVLRKISDKTITILQIITLNCNQISPEFIAPNDFFRDNYLLFCCCVLFNFSTNFCNSFNSFLISGNFAITL
ncbi:MAG: hypothetical protein LBC74_01365 [Planctomycetaceae bacterium]|nr:hypothetical protein [Planctomycetaceae bacterium]